MSGEVKDRRDDQADRGQRERDSRSARCAAAKMQFFVFGAAEEDGQTEHKQHVTNDRARKRGFHHTGQTLGKGDAGDNQLRGVSKGGVEQSSQALPDASRQSFGRAPDPARQRNDAESRANEKRCRTDPPWPEAQKDRHRNKDKKPVEGRFEFQNFKFRNLLQLINPSRSFNNNENESAWIAERFI